MNHMKDDVEPLAVPAVGATVVHFFRFGVRCVV